jgi:hypothetical protein
MDETIKYLRFEHNSLPDSLKAPLAQLFQARHKEFSEMPPHQSNYYLLPLQSKIDSEIGKLYCLAIKNEFIIGYGMLEYRENQYNENSGTIMIYVLRNERYKGIGKQIFHNLLPIPPHIQYIKSHVVANSKASEIVRKKFNIEPDSMRRQYYMLVKKNNLRNLEREISNLENLLVKDEIEVICVTSENYHQVSEGYAHILEYLWNVGMDNPELFPVERLHGRMEYFNKEGIFIYAILLKRRTEYIGLYEIIFYQTNKLVADESMYGVVSEYFDKNLLKLMKLKALHYILESTEVTHLESPIKNNEKTLAEINRELGFVIGKSFDHFKIPTEILTFSFLSKSEKSKNKLN